MSILPNEKVAIVGASGSGKSTLLKIMSCLYQPTAGEVYYDSLPTSYASIHQLRKHIGMVLQENVLFSGTFKENILMGRDYSDDEIMNSIRIANLGALIASFPLGLETRISESGHNFSGGQRQKISIARTVLSSPKIMFMDEPTSALDNISENVIMSNLFECCSTLVVAAHRLSMIYHFHKIVVMDQGKIVATGTHDELLKDSLHYQRLYERVRVDEQEESMLK